MYGKEDVPGSTLKKNDKMFFTTEQSWLTRVSNEKKLADEGKPVFAQTSLKYKMKPEI